MAENNAIKRNIGLDLSGVRDPQTRQQLIADQLKFGRQMKQANAAQNINYSPGQQQQNRSSPEEMQQFVNENRPGKENLPDFQRSEGNGKSPGQQPAFSHAPQPETQGKKRPVLTPDQVRQEGLRIAKEQTANSIPTSPLEGYEIARGVNEDNKTYNSEVEKDISQQVRAQETYGLKAVEELNKLYPESTAEHEALARRWGEEAVNEGHTSEAAIAKQIAQKTKNFKNTIANVKKSVPAPRLGQRVKESVLGTSRNAEKTRDDIRIKLQPLLKEGLYDTSRNVLSELGYHPEERESIITDLGEIPKRTLANMPEMKKTTPPGSLYAEKSERQPYYKPEDKQKISNSMRDILTSDPSTNLILLRKAYEDKGVDWQEFKDTLNDKIISGEIKLNDDQFNHLDLLDYPPLDRLDTLLYGLGLIGR